MRAIAPLAGSLSAERFFPCNNQTKPVPIMVRPSRLPSIRLTRGGRADRVGWDAPEVDAEGPGPGQSFHGTDDRLVSYESGVESINQYAQEVIRCTDSPVVRCASRQT